MAKGKAFDRPIAVAVEGIDFLHLMRTQFDGTACPNLWLYDLFEDREDSRRLADAKLKGSKQKQWLRNFQGQAREAGGNFKVRTLAIIRDAEDDAVEQFQAVSHALATVELPQPPTNGSYATGKWQGLDGFRVGVLVIPHDNSTGCLESCLLRAPKLNYGT